MLLNKPRAYEIMDRYGLDGLVAADPINLYYLTDFTSPLQRMGLTFTSFAVLPRNEDAPAALVISGSSLNHLERTPSWVPNVCVYNFPRALKDEAGNALSFLDLQGFDRPMMWRQQPQESYTARDWRLENLYAQYTGKTSANATLALVKALKDAGLEKANLGFDDPRILPWLNDIGLSALTGRDAWNIFREIRMVKSEAEIALLREAGQRNEQAINAAIDIIRPGVTADDIERAHRMKWAELDGQQLFLVAQWRGLSTGTIERGEIIKLDAVGTYKGYTGDIGRTVICGEPSADMVRRAKAVEKGLELAYELIRPGVSGAEVRAKVCKYIQDEGFPGFMAAGPHSVGLTHTDNPWSVGSDLPNAHGEFHYLENMVFTLDMPHHEFGWGTYHVEDMLVVRKDRCEPLTSLDTALRIRPG
jgi:Xaa-Pro aminopeptidase